MEARLNELERRLAAAEQDARQARRQVRRLTYVLAAGAVLLLVAAVARPGDTQAIRVTKVKAPFQVVDSAGRLLLLVENSHPGPHLQLFDSAGRACVELGMGTKGGGRLDVVNRAGKPVVRLGSTDAGGKLEVMAPTGKPLFVKP
jgi:hypothetical protein